MSTSSVDVSPVLFLHGKTAQDLMTPKIVSISDTATVAEGISLLMERDVNAVPVIDENGEPVGVLSRSDIVAHDREAHEHLHPSWQTDGKVNLSLRLQERRSGLFGVEKKRDVLVSDIMAKVIYSVTPRTPAKTVIDAMLAFSIHRLFVTDVGGNLLGVISSTDVLRHLQGPRTVAFEQVEFLDTSDGDCAVRATVGAGGQ